MRKIKAYQSKLNGSNMLEELNCGAKFEIEDIKKVHNYIRHITIVPERRYQEIIGFGGSFTETSSYNFSLMSDKVKEKIIEAYFDKEKGNAYNFCRTCIHSSDFGIERYTYVEDGDVELNTFSIDRDRKWVVPYIKAARERAGDDLHLFASPWSPPAWMKDNNNIIDGGRLLDEYYDTWAKYFVKYFEHYKKEGIEFFGLTVQNEPWAIQTWESCIYTAEEEGLFVHKNLKPALRAAGFDDVRIMIWDQNRERVYERARDTFNVPGAKDDIWGVAYHWYSGDHFEALSMTHEAFPDKPLILSEFCLGGTRGETAKGPHSSWHGAEIYANELIHNFNHYMAAATDWNMIVDGVGGPFHDRPAGCKAQIVVNPEEDTVSFEPTYYATAHFSRYIKRGAVRIGCSTLSEQVIAAAFENPCGEIVLVVLNRLSREEELDMRLDGYVTRVVLPAHSLTTYLIAPKGE